MQGGYGALQGQPLFRKLAAIYAEEANKTPRIKVNTYPRGELTLFLYFGDIMMLTPLKCDVLFMKILGEN